MVTRQERDRKGMTEWDWAARSWPLPVDSAPFQLSCEVERGGDWDSLAWGRKGSKLRGTKAASLLPSLLFSSLHRHLVSRSETRWSLERRMRCQAAVLYSSLCWLTALTVTRTPLDGRQPQFDPFLHLDPFGTVWFTHLSTPTFTDVSITCFLLSSLCDLSISLNN